MIQRAADRQDHRAERPERVHGRPEQLRRIDARRRVFDGDRPKVGDHVLVHGTLFCGIVFSRFVVCVCVWCIVSRGVIFALFFDRSENAFSHVTMRSRSLSLALESFFPPSMCLLNSALRSARVGGLHAIPRRRQRRRAPAVGALDFVRRGRERGYHRRGPLQHGRAGRGHNALA